MTETVVLALIALAGAVASGVLGWWAKIAVAKLAKPAESYNGAERRMKEVAKFEVMLHADGCPAKKDFADALDKTRRELKEDFRQVEERLTRELHSLHEEIQRGRRP